jgi:acetyltransferase
MWRRKQWLDALPATPELVEELPCDREMGKMTVEAGLEVLRQRDGEETGWMSPEQVEALLAAYCVHTPSSGLAPSIKHAIPLAETIGYPVALKLAAEGVVHKTDVGGVVLNITTSRDLKRHFKSLLKQASKHLEEDEIKGIYVQQMIRGEIELIVGIVRDPQFGPLVMVGTGGTQVEMKRDVAFELAPLTRVQAERMLDRTRAGHLLAGFRGSPPADRAAVIDTILQLAQIALDFPQITEVEINPLIVMEEREGVRAVDARVRLDRDSSP